MATLETVRSMPMDRHSLEVLDGDVARRHSPHFAE